MFSRLVQYWVYGGFLCGILLLILLPELAQNWSTALLAVFLQLPIYMLHQYEEHDNDRFRRFVNQKIGKGEEVLTPLDVFMINVPCVWGVIAAVFLLSASSNIGYGLIAIDLVLVNAVVHIVAAVVTRTYNPGLMTAIVLFLPAGLFGFYEIQKTGEIANSFHLLGAATAVGLHAAIIARVRIAKHSLRNSNPPGI